MLVDKVIAHKRICENITTRNVHDASPINNPCSFQAKISSNESVSWDWIETIPCELTEKIFSYVSTIDLLSIESVSALWKEKLMSGKTWANMLRKYVESNHLFQKTSQYLNFCSQICSKKLTSVNAKQIFFSIQETVREADKNWHSLKFGNLKLRVINTSTCAVSAVNISCTKIIAAFETEVRIWNRKSLQLEKVIQESNYINSILPLDKALCVFGMNDGIAKTVNLDNGVLMNSVVHQHGGYVMDLAFCNDVLVTRSIDEGDSDWTSIIIQYFAPDLTQLIKQKEFQLRSLSSGLGFDGQYLIVHTNRANSITNTDDAFLQIRTGDEWRIVDEINIPSECRNFQYSNKLIMVICSAGVRIFDLSGLCQRLVVIDFAKTLQSARINYPFILSCQYGRKITVWDLSTNDSYEELDLPSCYDLKFDNFQIVGVDEGKILVCDLHP